jgi:hypothetical protein
MDPLYTFYRRINRYLNTVTTDSKHIKLFCKFVQQWNLNRNSKLPPYSQIDYVISYLLDEVDSSEMVKKPPQDLDVIIEIFSRCDVDRDKLDLIRRK